MSIEFMESDPRRSVKNVLAASRQQVQQRSERVDHATRRAVELRITSPAQRRLLVRRAHRRFHSRIRLHPPPALDASSAARRLLESTHAKAYRKSLPPQSAAPAGGWRLEHLQTRPLRAERHRPRLHRTQALRLQPQRAGNGKSAPSRPRTRRTPGVQQLHEDQLQPASASTRKSTCPVSRRRSSSRPATSSMKCLPGRARSSFRSPSFRLSPL